MDNIDCIMEFINAMKTRRNLSPRTLRAYNSDLRAFERFRGSGNLKSTSTDNIQKYVSFLEGRDLCAASIKRSLASLKVLFQFLQSEGIITQTPLWRQNERYRSPKLLPRVIPRREVIKILTAAHMCAAAARGSGPQNRYLSVRNMLIIEMLFSLGLRIDELTQMDMEDVDPRGGSVVVHGKGRKERLLFLSNGEVLRLIGEYLPLREKAAKTPRAFFVNRNGTRLGNCSIGRIFASFCKKAGILRRYTPHCLRHTMATMLIENGADVRSVQEILGHSSISTTEIYIHISKERKREVLRRFNGRNSMHLLTA